MSKYANAVKVRKTAPFVWRADCPACEQLEVIIDRKALRRVYRWAVDHAATCEALHWANLADACPSCKARGRISPNCLACLGRGHIVEREGLT